MRPIVLATILFSLVAPQRKCTQLGNPEQIRQMAEQQMQQYFPNAKAVIVNQPKTILILTCSTGISQQFVVKLMNYMATDNEMQQQLHTINFSQFLGYQYFAIGFDSGWILYDINAKTLETRDITPQYAAAYGKTCSQ